MEPTKSNSSFFFVGFPVGLMTEQARFPCRGRRDVARQSTGGVTEWEGQEPGAVHPSRAGVSPAFGFVVVLQRAGTGFWDTSMVCLTSVSLSNMVTPAPLHPCMISIIILHLDNFDAFYIHCKKQPCISVVPWTDQEFAFICKKKTRVGVVFSRGRNTNQWLF